MKSSHISRSAIFNSFLGTSLSSIFVTALTFISGVLISRTLGPAGRGEYGAILLVVQTAASLGCLSFFEGSIVELNRYQDKVIDKLPTMLSAAMAITVLSSLATILMLPWLKLGLTAVTDHFLAGLIVFIAASQLIVQSFSALERIQLMFRMVNLERVISPAAFSVMILYAHSMSEDTFSSSLVLTLFMISRLPVILIWLFQYRRNLIGPLSLPFAKSSLLTGLRFHLAVALTILAMQLDRLIALATWPKEILGQYFVAYAAVGVGYSVITTAMYTVLMPFLATIPTEQRALRIGQIIRLTIVLIILILMSGCLILPIVIPFVYGKAFAPATDIAIGLLFAMSIVPLRAIVFEAGKSLGKGRPSTEMALASIITIYVGYLITGFAIPNNLVITIGVSQVFSTLVGARHMVRDRDIILSTTFLPTLDDLQLIKSIMSRMINR